MAKDEVRARTLSFKAQGGGGGRIWDDGAAHSSIKAIRIYCGGKCIDAIQIQYVDNHGNSIWLDKHGGNAGEEIVNDQVPLSLNYPDEYLISIHGCCGYIGPNKVIFSLTFETNQRSLGPYGVQGGTKFSFPTTGLKIVGFHGRSGWYLDAIGFHFLPISQSQKVDLNLPSPSSKGAVDAST